MSMTHRASWRSARRRALRAAVGVMLLGAAAQTLAGWTQQEGAANHAPWSQQEGAANHAPWKPRDAAAAGRTLSVVRANANYARFVPGAVAASKPGETGAPIESKAAAGAASPMTASGAAPGQAGYVHYFLIRKSDGTSEMQVGLELADQTIAWSFPGLGVVVSPFIESGTLSAKGKTYEVQHLFGIRAFPDDAAQAQLARDMPARIAPWIDDGVQHCDLDPPRRTMCVSCLGFVLRVLFPGDFPVRPALPAELMRTRAGERYTTEDLLLYLSGLHRVATREARLDRINELMVPTSLREELIRVVTADAAAQQAETSAVRNRRGGKAKAPRSPALRPRS